MTRNCNLDLCLAQPVNHLATEVVNYYSAVQQKEDAATAAADQNRQTIFYNGKVCVCDVTEFQAKAIISQAKKVAQDITISKTENNLLHLLEASNSSNLSLQSLSPSPSPSPSCSPAPPPPSSSCLISGVPMRKSLEQFLQKRKNRISAAAVPYQYRKSH